MKIDYKVWLNVVFVSFVIFLLAFGAKLVGRSESLAQLIVAVIGTGATVFLAIGVRQLELQMQHMRLESLHFIYEMFEDPFKNDLHELIKLSNQMRLCTSEDDSSLGADIKSSAPSSVRGDLEQKIAKITAVFNRIGYYVYRDYLELDYIYDLFGLLILRAFVAFKECLVTIRNKQELPDSPWYFRRHFLLLVVALENRFFRDPFFQKELLALYKKANSNPPSHLKDLPILVPRQWLSHDIIRWLKSRHYIV